MNKLISFYDDEHKGRRANIRMDNGDPCWISINQARILVKKSKIGIFGPKLYERKNMSKAARTAKVLSCQYLDDLTPDGMRDPVLKSIVNAVLHCSDLAEATRVLNEADLKAESQAKDADILISDFFKNNLMVIADRIRKTNELPESENLEDNVTLVLAHIIYYIQGKVSHFPVKDHARDSDVLTGMVFLYFVGSQLILHLRDEGIKVSINNVIAKTAVRVFQFLDSEKIARIAHAGMEQYKAIVRSGGTRESIRSYTQKVGSSVLAYVMSRDDQLLDVFSALFLTLIDTQENLLLSSGPKLHEQKR